MSFAAKSDGSSTEPVISADGTAVAFATTATNLDGLLGPDGDTDSDVYRRTLSGTMTLVSRIAGGMKANGESFEPAISDDGRYVAFVSTATNLDPADTGSTDSVYRYDVVTPTQVLVSRQSAADGGVVAGSYATDPAISGNGDVVAFSTLAPNLDGPSDPDSADSDIYVRRVSTSVTTLVSRATGVAGTKGLGDSYRPAINDSGTRVAFISRATNLGFTPPPDSDAQAVFERDLAGATTTLLSTGPGGPGVMRANRVDYAGASSVVFAAGDGPGLSPDQNGLTTQVFFRAPPANPELVSRPSGTGTTAIARFVGAYTSYIPGARQISQDGRYVVFQTYSPGILSAGSTPIKLSIARRDLLTGETILISRASGADGAPADQSAQDPTISADGNRIVFGSTASNLDPADGHVGLDIFVRDVAAATTSLVSRADGATGNAPDGSSFDPRISADGHWVAFASDAANLVSGDSNARRDAFVRGIDAGTTTLVSRADGAAGALGGNDTNHADVSGDGRLAVFETTASNFGDGDSDAAQDVFVRDLAAGTTRLVSRADGDGVKATAHDVAISADGRVVAFESSATSLGLPAGSQDQVFVRDLAARTTRLVSATPGGARSDESAALGGLSSDGATVLFTTAGTNLGVTPPTESNEVYERRMPDGAPRAISRRDGENGALLDGYASGAAISGDGTCAAYTARGGGLVDGISPDYQQVYVRTLSSECPKDPPETTITSGPSGTVATSTVDFGFSSDEAGSTFECSVNGAAFAACASPLHRSGLADGPFTFAVRATDPAGFVDPTPASRTVTIAVPPSITAFSFAPRSFFVGPGRTAISAAKKKKRRTGTKITADGDRGRHVRIAITRQLPGRRVGKSCRKPTRSLRKRKACKRTVTEGTLTRRAKGTTTKITFTGRVGKTRLAVGTHGASATVTDAAGNRSKTRQRASPCAGPEHLPSRSPQLRLLHE